jgi:hypothetical protein
MVSVGAQTRAEAGSQPEGNRPAQRYTSVEPTFGAGLQVSVKLHTRTEDEHWTSERIKINLSEARRQLGREVYLHFRDQALAAVRQTAVDLHGADSIREIVVKPWLDHPEDEAPLSIVEFSMMSSCFISFNPDPGPNNGLDDHLHLTVIRHPGREIQVDSNERNSSTYARAVLSTPGCPISYTPHEEAGPELSLVR